MARCPKCNQNCNPLKFLLISKWSPYVCSKCKARSDFTFRQNVILGLVTGLLFGILSLLLVKKIGAVGMIISIILIILIVPVYQYYFMKLQLIEKDN